MGNSPPTGGLRLGSGDNSYVTDIRGSSVCIMFKGREIEKDKETGEITESWLMMYTGKSDCYFMLSKSLDNQKIINPNSKLEIKIIDKIQSLDECFGVFVEKDETGLLLHKYASRINFPSMTNVTTRTTNVNGDITEMSFDVYGNGSRGGGLVIREWKRRSQDKNPYTGTVVHYYVNFEKDNNVGLSVAVKKIRVMENGKFDFAVDGPEQHPLNALEYMFKEVFITKTWKPTMCPHCASRYIQDRQSDSESDMANFPVGPSQGGNNRRRGGGGLVNNDGRIMGNYNGSTFIKNFVNRRYG